MATLLPLALILVALAALNLERVVFQLMSGIRPEQHWPHAIAYGIVTLLAAFSLLASPVLLGIYVAMIIKSHNKRSKAPH